MRGQHDVFPHLLTSADILGPGPAPRYVCSRPSCRLAYRSLAHVRRLPPPCPLCGHPWLPGPMPLTHAQRAATEGW